MIDAGQIDLSEFISKEIFKAYLLAQPYFVGDMRCNTINSAPLNKEKTIFLLVNDRSGLSLARDLSRKQDSPETRAVIVASALHGIRLEFYWYSRKIAKSNTDQELVKTAERYRKEIKRLYAELEKEGLKAQHYKEILEPIYSIKRDI